MSRLNILKKLNSVALCVTKKQELAQSHTEQHRDTQRKIIEN